jgi:ATP-dependent exoDNAse (exonuclease V) beta subunit
MAKERPKILDMCSEYFRWLIEADVETVGREVTLQYTLLDRPHQGTIDHIAKLPDTPEGQVEIIDYKTHRHATTKTIPGIARNYHQQMRFYSEAVRRLWPDRAVKAALLFTRPGVLHQIELT